MRSTLLSPFLLGLAALPAAGQFSFDEPTHAAAELFVRVDGFDVQAVVRVEIDSGWHVYHDDLGGPGAIGLPTEVIFDAAGVEWGDPVFSEPERYEQPGLGPGGGDTWIYGHADELIVRVEGTLDDADSLEPDEVLAEIVGQVCDDATCLPYAETVEGTGPGPDALFADFAGSASSAPVSMAFGAEGQEAAAELSIGLEGDRVVAWIEVRIDHGWHLYHSELGPNDAVGKPTTVEFEVPGVPDLRFESVVFSEPERLEQPGLGDGGRDTWIWSHEGTLQIAASAPLPAGFEVADLDGAAVRIDGLTCKQDGLCIPYSETVEAFPLADPNDLSAALGLLEGAGDPAPTEEAAPGEGSDEEGGSSLLAFLGLAVFWGLFTLLMPCTYPMIPITISFFTKQAEARDGRVLPLALAYGAGIVGIFVLVGLLVGPAIIRFATHPVVNVVIGLAFVYFAFVLFGAINLNPPRFLMDAAGKASTRGGLVGVFLMGATLVITSFTCTAPFVGSLLSVGATGDGASLTRIALGMATFGATMAIPFIALSLVPGRISTIPSAGAWMNTLKVALGFIELAAALKFISNADLVWGWGVLSRELFLVLWTGIMLTAAFYLFGFVRLKGESGEIGPGRMAGAMGFLLFGLYCGYGAQG
ncbi:MAG: protein-disulfide reductase DsbD domain-containing protein, partial [Planctomycetota bacterium]